MLIDLLNPATFANGHPHKEYEWLRENDPVHWHEEPNGPGFWALTRYEDVAASGRDAKTFSSEPTIMITDPEAGTALAMDDDHKMMLMMDPPQHTQFRRLISREFTRGPAADLRPRIQELTKSILNALPEGKGEVDFVSAVAGELPSAVIADLMGIPLDDGRKLYALTEILHTSPEALPKGAMAQAGADMFAYAAKVFEEKNKKPGEDLATQIVQAEVDGYKLDLLDFQLFFMLLIDAGGDTTRNLVSGGLERLVNQPETLNRLRADFSLIPSARDEMLRTVCPVTYMRRTATTDTQLGDKKIASGDKVVRYFAAANHDPRKFDNPQDFDISRTDNAQIAFGTGTHVCLGQHIARVEIDYMFEALLGQLHDIKIIEPPEWLASNFISGIKSMPISYTKKE
jgi:cytochrome P450